MDERVQLHPKASRHRHSLQGSGLVLIADGVSEKEAKKEAISIVEGVQSIVPRLLCLQGYGGLTSPMDRI
jgi:hypothetical protein